RADGPAGVGDQARAVAPGGLEEGAPWLGAQGTDGEDSRHAEATSGDHECADQQAAAGDDPAALEVLLEVLALVLVLTEDVARFDERTLRHQAVGPRHQPVGEAGEGGGEEGALGL